MNYKAIVSLGFVAATLHVGAVMVVGDANTTTVVTPDATTITVTNNATLTVTVPGEIEILLVGGGGAGGLSSSASGYNGGDSRGGGGGGGGGVIHKTNFNVSAGTYEIVVGAGGAFCTSVNSTTTAIGGSTSGFGLTALGGGPGGWVDPAYNSYTVSNLGASGGGGAGAAARGVGGGDGYSCDITGTMVYYGGGGKGGERYSTAATPGQGGGKANYGGGGSAQIAWGNPESGGHGIVAERYFVATAAAIRRHDPNHLVLGCRFAGAIVPDVVWQVAGRHCDIVTLNAYARAELEKAGLKNVPIHLTEWLSAHGVGTARQAAILADTIVRLQGLPVDLATIYDARCSSGMYSPLFDPAKWAPRKAYYAFRAFGELYARGMEVPVACSNKEIAALAAVGPGGGINRKVVLKTMPKAHFVYSGIAVTTPVAEKDRSVVRVRWEMTNAVDGAQVKVRLLLDGAEKACHTTKAEKGEILIEVAEPKLWDIDSPCLYQTECTLASGGETATEAVRFGIRKIAFPVGVGADANVWEKNGFHLNGRRVQLKGVNLHEDMGLLGRAYSRSAVRRQLLLMKDMGANAIRTSHNPVAPETLDLCDELGLLVWDECFDKWDDTASRLPEEPLEPYIERNLRAFVRRDRNHSSVIVWPMGNEIGGVAGEKKDFTHDPDGMTRERCAQFRDAMRDEDATRPVGNGNMPHVAKDEFFDRGIWDDLDITGWNYLGSHEKAKAKYPMKPVIYSESASAGSTYGFYAGPSVTPYGYKKGAEFAAKQMDSYDLGTTIDIADLEFDRMEMSPWCAGGASGRASTISASRSRSARRRVRPILASSI